MEVFVVDVAQFVDARRHVHDSDVLSIIISRSGYQIWHQKVRKKEVTEIIDCHLWLEAVFSLFVGCAHDSS